jgi:ribosomal protein L11 methyltransferase
MKWNKYTLKTTADAEDIIVATLADIGIQGVEIEDKRPLTEEEMSQMFVDIAPKFSEDDNIAYLHFYLEPEEDNEAIIEAAKAELEELRQFMDIGECIITKSQTEDKDWINNWKEYFHHFYVDDILIVPSWEEVPAGDEDKLVLHIDPGTAFGTGMHETTQLCIRQLKKHIFDGCDILDVGTGSGILSIVGIKLGAGSALGTDLDPCCINAVKENKEVNDIPEESFKLILGNIIDDKDVQDKAGYEKYDIVTANILADVLVLLAPQIIKHLKKGGIIITSGILDIKEQEVAEALRNAGFEIDEVTRQGEWVSVTARK